MRESFEMFVGLVFLCFVILTVVCPNAQAAQYAGEYCWEFGGTRSSRANILRLGVFHIGDDHYLVSGTTEMTETSLNKALVNGNMELIRGEVRINLSKAWGMQNFARFLSLEVVLDEATLDGIAYGMELTESPELFQSHYQEYTMTSIHCP